MIYKIKLVMYYCKVRSCGAEPNRSAFHKKYPNLRPILQNKNKRYKPETSKKNTNKAVSHPDEDLISYEFNKTREAGKF